MSSGADLVEAPIADGGGARSGRRHASASIAAGRYFVAQFVIGAR